MKLKVIGTLKMSSKMLLDKFSESLKTILDGTWSPGNAMVQLGNLIPDLGFGNYFTRHPTATGCWKCIKVRSTFEQNWLFPMHKPNFHISSWHRTFFKSSCKIALQKQRSLRFTINLQLMTSNLQFCGTRHRFLR